MDSESWDENMDIIFEEVPDFPKDKIEVVVKSYQENKVVRDVIAYLSDFNLSTSEYLPLKTSDKIVMVAIKDIVLAEVEGTRLTITTVKGKYVIIERLYRLKEKIQPMGFVQVSKHTLVNVNHLDYLEDSFSGNMLAVFSSGDKTIVSRKYLKDLLQFLGL